MDVEQFVAETLKQICRGVASAQSEVADTGKGVISPSVVQADIATAFRALTHPKTHTPIKEVEFDLAVTVTEASGSEGKLSLSVFPIKAGIGGESSKAMESVSRVKFVVPIALPPQKA